jgi:hypothetical protein
MFACLQEIALALKALAGAQGADITTQGCALTGSKDIWAVLRSYETRRRLRAPSASNCMANLQDTDMARPKTQSKPKPKKPKPEAPIVKVRNSSGMQVPEKKAEQIAAAHMAGMSVRQICRAYNTSHHTVMALIRNRADLLEKAREITSRNWRTLAAVGTAELFDRVPDMRSHELTIMSAVATEKAELLSGGATQRVEHVMAPAADAWADFVAGLKRREDAVDVAFQPVEALTAEPQKAAALPEPLIEIETGPTEELK